MKNFFYALGAWFWDTLDNAKNLGVFQVAGLFFLSGIFGMQWILMGEAWSSHYDQATWTALRHAWLPFIPDIMSSGSLGNFMALWFLIIVGFVAIGAIVGMFVFAGADPNWHYKFAVEAKDQCQGYYLENGLMTMGISALNGNGGSISSVAMVFLSARNFLTAGMTRYATPYFLVLNTVFGTVVMSITGLALGSYLFWIFPAAWQQCFGTFEGNPDHGVAAVVAAILLLAPCVALGVWGLVCGIVNSVLMGVGLMGWVLSFLPGRWKARRAYRMRAGLARLYLNEDHEARPVDDNFLPVA